MLIVVRTYLKNNLKVLMAALRSGSKCSHTTCMLRFFTVSRLALNPNLIFEIGSKINPNLADNDRKKTRLTVYGKKISM
jgi:hypothetical protein